MEAICYYASELQAGRLKEKATTENFTMRVAKLSELDLNAHFMGEDSVCADNLYNPLNDKVGQLKAVKRIWSPRSVS